MKGYNDDLVISLAIGCWVRDTALITNQRDIEYKKAFLGAMISSNTKIETKVAGMQGYKRKFDHGIMDKDDLSAKRREAEEFSWLYKG